MTDVRRIVPDVACGDPDLGRAFFTGVLGLEEKMNMGWIATYVSPSNPTAQINVMRPVSPMPAVSVEVADVDAVHRAAVAAGHRIVHPLTDEPWGVRRFFVEGPGGLIVNVMSHR